MQVTLKPEPVFTVTMGDNTVERMRQTGAWKGFIELTAEDGKGTLYLLDPRAAVRRALDHAWDNAWDAQVISGSPELIARLQRGLPTTAPGATS